MGLGNFQVGLYYKLMHTLKDDIEDEEERKDIYWKKCCTWWN